MEAFQPGQFGLLGWCAEEEDGGGFAAGSEHVVALLQVREVQLHLEKKKSRKIVAGRGGRREAVGKVAHLAVQTLERRRG